MSNVTNELLSLAEVARQLQVTLDEALALIETHLLPAGRGRDGGVYVRDDDLRGFERTHTNV